MFHFKFFLNFKFCLLLNNNERFPENKIISAVKPKIKGNFLNSDNIKNKLLKLLIRDIFNLNWIIGKIVKKLQLSSFKWEKV